MPKDRPTDRPTDDLTWLMVQLPAGMKREYKVRCAAAGTDLSKQTRALVAAWLAKPPRAPRAPRRSKP